MSTNKVVNTGVVVKSILDLAFSGYSTKTKVLALGGSLLFLAATKKPENLNLQVASIAVSCAIWGAQFYESKKNKRIVKDTLISLGTGTVSLGVALAIHR